MSGADPVEITPVLHESADPLQQLEQQIQTADSDVKTQVQGLLKLIARQMAAAEQLWQTYLDNPSASDDRFTVVMWIGAERSRALHRIHLDLRDQARELTTASGVAFRDTVGIAAMVDIVEAYDQLQAGETGPQRAEQAIATIAARRQRIEALLISL